MIFTSLHKAVLLLAALAATVQLGHSQSAWTPQAREFVLTPLYTYESAGSLYNSRERIGLFGTSWEQHSFTVVGEYGITPKLAADVAVGYVSSTFDGKGLGRLQDNRETIDGLNDTKLGLRYKLVDEFETGTNWIPTLTARLGAIIEGTYAADYINSPGDGASGVEGSLLFGKSYQLWGGIGYFGSIGYRHRGEGVPEELLSSIGIYKVLYRGLTGTFTFRDERSLSGITVEEVLLGNTRLQQLQDIRSTVEFGLSYRDGGNRTYGVAVGHLVDGENTFDRTSYTAYLSLPF